MADTFFGFDTTISVDDDGGGGLGDNEEDYDAFNSETFDAAINGDWENTHENLVLLDQSDDIKEDENDDDDDSDLEINFSRVGMDDFDVAKEDTEGRIQLDPSVWANPPKPLPHDPFNIYGNPDYLRQHLSNQYAVQASGLLQQESQHQLHQHIHNQQHQNQQHHNQQHQNQQHQNQQHQNQQHQNQQHQNQQHQNQQHQNQQHQNQQHQNQQHQNQQHQNQQHQNQQHQNQQHQNQQHQQHMNSLLESLHSGMQTAPPPHKIISVEDIERSIRIQQKQTPAKFEPLRSQTPQHQRPPQNQLHQQVPFTRSPSVPPGLPPPKGLFPAYHSQLPANNNLKPIRLPPGFPAPMQLLQHPMHGIQRQLPPNLPVALNNFAMHPHFNAMRGNGGVSLPHRLPPPNLTSPHYQPNVQNLPVSANQFNQRLVQEIQQNHPMLPFNRLNNNFNNHPQLNQIQMQHHNNNNNINHGINGKNSQMQQLKVNGNLNDEYDEYANLMSKRDKQWLITIQLSQLNTGTPYIDDYYYTVFKERKSKLKGERENKAHKDNQLNHPFSQPKGHAQLVIMSMGNKNGMNQRNGQNNRERKNSESNKDKEQTPRTYTPLQFENSLGKLQCGSVTAPRKIIDMDVVGPESSSPFTTSIEISAQRKSRQLLMHIETLYRIVLKLEDLENPTAIATFLIVKERKEKERLAALEQQMLDNVIKNKEIISSLNLDSTGNSVRSSMSLTEKEDEGRDELLPKLLLGLTSEKVAHMMTVRKGKTLLRRIMPLIKNSIHRWEVWYTIFATLPLIVKKDKDDIDGHLLAMFPEFKNQIQHGSIMEVVKLANSMISVETRLSYMFKNKFFISCIIVLILRAEYIYNITDDPTAGTSKSVPSSWITFLTTLVNAANKNANLQTSGATAQSDNIKALVSHFSRFRELKSQQLLAALTQCGI